MARHPHHLGRTGQAGFDAGRDIACGVGGGDAALFCPAVSSLYGPSWRLGQSDAVPPIGRKLRDLPASDQHSGVAGSVFRRQNTGGDTDRAASVVCAGFHCQPAVFHFRPGCDPGGGVCAVYLPAHTERAERSEIFQYLRLCAYSHIVHAVPERGSVRVRGGHTAACPMGNRSLWHTVCGLGAADPEQTQARGQSGRSEPRFHPCEPGLGHDPHPSHHWGLGRI